MILKSWDRKNSRVTRFQKIWDASSSYPIRLVSHGQFRSLIVIVNFPDTLRRVEFILWSNKQKSSKLIDKSIESSPGEMSYLAAKKNIYIVYRIKLFFKNSDLADVF